MDRYERGHGGEETSLWTAAAADLRAFRDLHAQGESTARQVAKLKKSLHVATGAGGGDDDVRLLENVDQLQDASKSYIETLERESAMVEKLRESLDLLVALRQATEAGVGGGGDDASRRKKRKLGTDSAPSVANGGRNRDRESSRDRAMTDDGASDTYLLSGTPPPGRESQPTGAGPTGRHKKGKTTSGTMSSSNGETTGGRRHANSASTSGNGSTGTKSAPAEELVCRVGVSVAFRQPRTKQGDGDWIQCVILRMHGDGPKARVEVQDPEPDENGLPGQTYKTNVAHLIPIPRENTGLAPHPRGTTVLARYPETTTFYKAEVIGNRRDICLLKFEGEEEIGKETEVERRLVLEYPK